MYRNKDQAFAVLVCVWETMKTGSEELGQDDRKRAGELLKAHCHRTYSLRAAQVEKKKKKLDKRHERKG